MDNHVHLDSVLLNKIEKNIEKKYAKYNDPPGPSNESRNLINNSMMVGHKSGRTNSPVPY